MVKDFLWGDGDTRNVLVVQTWESDDPGERYTKYTRVADPASLSTPGTWTHERNDELDDDGHLIQERWTIVVDDDSFTYNYVQNGGRYEFEITGSWTHDTENKFALVLVEELMSTSERPRDYWVGQTLRFAYAPTSAPNAVRISTFWDEQSFNAVTTRWEDREDRPYGDYWLPLERQNN